MKRYRLAAAVLGLGAMSMALGACGGSGAATASSPTTAPTASMVPGAADPTGAPSGDVDSMGDAASIGTMDEAADPSASAGSDLLPFNTILPEVGGANDGGGATIPQGKVGAAAVADGLGKDGVTVVTVTSTNTTCVPDRRTIPAGPVWFKLVNQSPKVNELYLETPDGEELVEVEKVPTGQTGAFKTTVEAGVYLVACEPGMADQQVLTGITVTG